MENGRKLQYVVTCAVSVLAASFGYLTSWISPMVLKFWSDGIDFKVDHEVTDWYYKIIPISFLVGTLFGGYICERFGRRTTLLISIVISAFGSIFAAFSSATWMLYVMFSQWSFALAILFIVGNIYLAEILDPDIRGGLIVATTVMFQFGSILMIWLGPHFSYRGLNNWIIVVSLLSFAAIYPIPESPYYLLKVGKEEQAKKEFSRLQENVGGDIDANFEKMKSHVNLEMKNPSSFFKLFSSQIYRKALIATFGLKLFYMLSGQSIMQRYTLTIIIEGTIQLNPRHTLDIDVGIKIVIGILAALLVDRLGRRILLLISFIGSTISMVIFGFYFVIRDNSTDLIKAIANVLFVAYILFQISNAFGIASIYDIIEVELFPVNVRVMAVVCLYIFGGLSYPFNMAFHGIEESAGRHSIFWTTAGINVVAFIFTYYVVPETKRRHLKDIQVMLQGDLSEQEMTSTNI